MGLIELSAEVEHDLQGERVAPSKKTLRSEPVCIMPVLTDMLKVTKLLQ